jgi:hypothetical protein
MTTNKSKTSFFSEVYVDFIVTFYNKLDSTLLQYKRLEETLKELNRTQSRVQLINELKLISDRIMLNV